MIKFYYYYYKKQLERGGVFSFYYELSWSDVRNRHANHQTARRSISRLSVQCNGGVDSPYCRRCYRLGNST